MNVFAIPIRDRLAATIDTLEMETRRLRELVAAHDAAIPSAAALKADPDAPERVICTYARRWLALLQSWDEDRITFPAVDAWLPHRLHPAQTGYYLIRTEGEAIRVREYIAPTGTERRMRGQARYACHAEWQLDRSHPYLEVEGSQGSLLLLSAPTQKQALNSPLFKTEDDQVEGFLSYDGVKRHLRGYVI
jgi:hypothetical protein